MKIFSKSPKTMRADRWTRLLNTILFAGIAAFIISLGIPKGEVAQAAFAIMAVVLTVASDLRDRAREIFDQNERILLASNRLQAQVASTYFEQQLDETKR